MHLLQIIETQLLLPNNTKVQHLTVVIFTTARHQKIHDSLFQHDKPNQSITDKFNVKRLK